VNQLARNNVLFLICDLENDWLVDNPYTPVIVVLSHFHSDSYRPSFNLIALGTDILPLQTTKPPMILDH
jgi:hypothetical protein